MNKYGVQWAEGATDEIIELHMAFDCGHGDGVSLHQAPGFEGAYEHLHRAIDLIWNKRESHFIWNEWTEWILGEICSRREISLCGPGASWKTTCMSVHANASWFASPMKTRNIFISTTLEGLRARAWKEVIRFYRAAGQPFGNPVNHPHPKIQTIKGDDGAGIFGIAVEAGDVDKAVENIKGRHSPYANVYVDEMTGVSGAIVAAGANLEKGTTSFKMIGAANPVSKFDQHGMFSEPKAGWESITVNTDRWETKRGGIAVHLDGLKAPNVVARKKINPGMISYEDIEISRMRDGENSPVFWSQVRGFWPPEGIEKTVLTETIISRCKVREQPVWAGDKILLAAADPAFEGGDRKPIRFAEVGLIVVGDPPLWTPNGMDFSEQRKSYMALCFTEMILLKLDVTSKEPIHYQLARMYQDECEKRHIPPKYFALDTTGEGGGVASILKREWSFEFLEVEFGGLASMSKVSDVDPRPRRERYDRRVTDLWYQFRTACERGKIRGLDLDTCREFCQRNYDLQGNRISVETKTKMKQRIGCSPDLADDAVIMLELASVKIPGFWQEDGNPSISADTRWKDFASKYDVSDPKEAYMALDWK